MKLEDLKNKEFEITSEGLLKVVEKKTGRFVPKEGEKYWFINSKGCIDWVKYGNNDTIDRWVINHTPVFATYEEVEEYERYLETLDKYKYNFTAEEWKDNNINKCFLNYDIECDAILHFKTDIIRDARNSYFKTREDAELFIREVGKENVKKFMFDIWE